MFVKENKIKSLYKYILKYLYLIHIDIYQQTHMYAHIVRLNSLKYYQLIQITINHNSPRTVTTRIKIVHNDMKMTIKLKKM